MCHQVQGHELRTEEETKQLTEEEDLDIPDDMEIPDEVRRRGYISEKTIKGNVYLYLQWREGDTVVSEYLRPNFHQYRLCR